MAPICIARVGSAAKRLIGSALPIVAVLLATAPASAASVDEHLRDPDLLLKADCTGGDLFLPKKFYAVCYHADWRIARWVAYHLTPGDIGGDAPRKKNFREDPDIQNLDARSKETDYRSSGYARGHQAPAEDFSRSDIAMASTFVLSNAAPQTTQLNSGKWRVLEDQARNATGVHRGAWIFTGSLFAQETRDRDQGTRTFKTFDPRNPPKDDKRPKKEKWIGNERVAVPTHSFKAVLIARDNGSFVAYGFILPNQRQTLPGDVPFYQVSVREIEDLAGIDFFKALDKRMQDRLEADVPAWPPKREARK